MKKIETIIKPFLLESIKTALEPLGDPAMVVSEIREYGHSNHRDTVYRGMACRHDNLLKLKLEILLEDTQVDAVIQALTKAFEDHEIENGELLVVAVDAPIHLKQHRRAFSAAAV